VAKYDVINSSVIPGPPSLKRFENIVAHNASGFSAGEKLTYADLALFLLLEEVEILAKLANVSALENYKSLSAFKHKLAETPSIRDYTHDPKRTKSFFSQIDCF